MRVLNPGLMLALGLAGWVSAAPSEVQFDPGIRASVLNAISQAQTQIQVEMFKLTDRGAIARLGQAASRGVSVRVILCPSQKANQISAATLRQNGVQVRWYPLSQPKQIMHLKFALLDGRRLWFGSANWTYWGLTRHHEGALIIDDPGCVEIFRQQFSADWDRAGVGESSTSRATVPDNVTSRFLVARG